MKPTLTQTVNYVAAPSEEGQKPQVKKAVITHVHGESRVTLDHSAGTEKEPAGMHTALADYAPAKENKPNTWHFADEAASNGAGKTAAAKKEGAAA